MCRISKSTRPLKDEIHLEVSSEDIDGFIQFLGTYRSLEEELAERKRAKRVNVRPRPLSSAQAAKFAQSERAERPAGEVVVEVAIPTNGKLQMTIYIGKYMSDFKLV